MSHAESLIGANVAAANTTSFERGLKYSSYFFEKVYNNIYIYPLLAAPYEIRDGVRKTKITRLVNL